MLWTGISLDLPRLDIQWSKPPPTSASESSTPLESHGRCTRILVSQAAPVSRRRPSPQPSPGVPGEGVKPPAEPAESPSTTRTTTNPTRGAHADALRTLSLGRRRDDELLPSGRHRQQYRQRRNRRLQARPR